MIHKHQKKLLINLKMIYYIMQNAHFFKEMDILGQKFKYQILMNNNKNSLLKL